MIHDYETLTSDLLEWIKNTIDVLNDRTFANSLNGVQQQLSAFNTYRTVEKPPKWVQRKWKVLLKKIHVFEHYLFSLLFSMF